MKLDLRFGHEVDPIDNILSEWNVHKIESCGLTETFIVLL